MEDSVSRQHRLTEWLRLVGVAILLLCLIWSLPVGSAAAQSDTGTRVHIVRWGETLSRIAAQYGVSAQAIMAANHLADPNRIYAGQQLIIPGTGGAATTAPSGTHVVQRGENLYRIGLKYGLTVTELMAANGLVNPNQIYAGQVLKIQSAGAPAPANEPTPTQPADVHVVQRGETLSEIASRYGVSVWALAQANNIGNPSVIYAGQVLTIPAGGGPATSSPQATEGYTVRRGDTLFRIAMRFGVTVDALVAANGLASPNHIYAGQVLRIPSTGGPVGSGPAPSSHVPAAPTTGGKLIVVDLSEQRIYAYEGGQIVGQFLVSTGRPGTPTVRGDFAVYLKYNSQRMRGPGYDLPNVPWVMYFYRGYAIHGTYWHNNFGQTMSHGCVNMRIADAEWLYMWAPIGTPVRVQY